MLHRAIRDGERGVTVVEALVVVTILALVAGVVGTVLSSLGAKP